MDHGEQSITSAERRKSGERRSSRAVLDVESALFSTTSPSTYGLFVPLHFERGYAYPLIVWLHGQGADERQLMRVMPMVSMRNYVAVAPRGVRMMLSSSGDCEGHGWRQSEDVIEEAQRRIFESIEAVGEKFRYSRQRVFLAGFGTGGTMAFRVAFNHPRRFAGVLSFCGCFPSGHTPFSNLTDARRLAVLLAVGRRSQEFPSADVCRDLRLLHTAGLATTLREYPCGHELAPQMLADLDRWIIEQVTSEDLPAGKAS